MVTRIEKYPAEQHERIVAFKAFAHEGMLSLARAEIDWAHKGLTLLDRLASPIENSTAEPVREQ